MRRLRCTAAVAAALLAGCATTAGTGWTRFDEGGLDQWLRDAAVPALAKTFGEHPRFRGETVNVAVLDGVEVAASSNALAAAVRDTVYAALTDVPGLRLNRLEGPGGCSGATLDGYYLAVETTSVGRRQASVRLRVFDIVEQRWIAGFGGQWQGGLSPAQSEAAQRVVVADTARGQRVRPFGADESDLLAGHLATELACRLRRAGNDEVPIAPARHAGASLVAGNLAGHGIPVDARGDVELDTRVHRVDASLFQVWAILTPSDPAARQSAVAVSAYASRPLLQPASGTIAARRAAPPAAPATHAPLLSRLTVTAPAPDCSAVSGVELGERPLVAAGGCFGIEFRRASDATVFVLEHAADGSLWRRIPSRCESIGTVHDEVVRFPGPPDHLAWLGAGAAETYYVFAARGRTAAARLERLTARLPDRCDDGPSGKTTSGWLDDLDRVVNAHGDDLAWQAVRIRHGDARTNDRAARMTGASQ